MYYITQATAKAQADVAALYDQAKLYFAQNGINQWQNGTPNETTFLQDVKNEESYIVLEDNSIVATFMFSDAKEPTYDKIFGGSWRLGESYAVLHRIAVAPSCKGKCILANIVEFAAERASQSCKLSLRCDTHADNISMQKALLKNGFTYSGDIFLDKAKTDARLAYEKPL